MRFSKPYELKKTELEFDVLIVDTVGVPFNAAYVYQQGMGGSEFQAALLLEELAKRGFKCGCINKGPFASVSPAGVKYFPLPDLTAGIIKPRARNLISMRTGSLPSGIDFQNAYFWLHDIPDDRLRTVHGYLEQLPDAVAVCVSEWQSSQCPPGWESATSVIHNMIPDWVYEYKPTKPRRENFIYASAAIKGLDATLEVWGTLVKQYGFKKERLDVLSPGYDQPSDLVKKTRGVSFLGSKPFAEVVERIAEAKGLFYVNTFPETFGIVPVIAEIVGTPTHILCVNDVGALDEVLTRGPTSNAKMFQERVFGNMPTKIEQAKDYRASVVINKWIELLGLGQKESSAA